MIMQTSLNDLFKILSQKSSPIRFNTEYFNDFKKYNPFIFNTDKSKSTQYTFKFWPFFNLAPNLQNYSK